MTPETSHRIKKLRLDRKLTQQELATGIGVTKSAVSRWESGQVEPDKENVTSLCDFFGVTKMYLAGFGSEEFNEDWRKHIPGKEAALLGAVQLDWDIAYRAAQLMMNCPALSELKEGQHGKAFKQIYTMGVRDFRMLRIDTASAIIMSVE